MQKSMLKKFLAKVFPMMITPLKLEVSYISTANHVPSILYFSLFPQNISSQSFEISWLAGSFIEEGSIHVHWWARNPSGLEILSYSSFFNLWLARSVPSAEALTHAKLAVDNFLNLVLHHLWESQRLDMLSSISILGTSLDFIISGFGLLDDLPTIFSRSDTALIDS